MTIQQSILSTCHLLGSSPMGAPAPQAAGDIHAGIPGGHQCQGQVPERKDLGQLSLGGRRGCKLHTWTKGTWVPGGRWGCNRKGKAGGCGGCGREGAHEQAEQAGSQTLRATPGKACPGPVVSGAPQRS